MKTVQLRKYKNEEWQYLTPAQKLIAPLVLVFGDRHELEEKNIYKMINKIFPKSHVVFGSTSGNITSNSIDDDCITITAIEFERSTFDVKTINLSETNLNSYQAGELLVNKLPKDKLKYILILSEGSFVNGSELIKGMNLSVANNVLITGGICADATRFKRTVLSYNENPKDGEIVAIGFYGDTLEITSSVHGEWIPFGPERVVTKSKGNILYELDNKPVLDLYKKYLGEIADKLPAAALYYPLGINSENEERSSVRTILNISEEYKAMIFTGDIPLNSKVQLMITNVNSLEKGSAIVAKQALEKRVAKPQLTFLVSCAGRKLLLDQRVMEEVEGVKKIIGNDAIICGFYAYGELAPFEGDNMCQLHNQSAVLTLISE